MFNSRLPSLQFQPSIVGSSIPCPPLSTSIQPDPILQHLPEPVLQPAVSYEPVQIPTPVNAPDNLIHDADPLNRLDFQGKSHSSSRSSRQSKPPTRYGDWAYLTQLAAADDISLEPGNITEALASLESDKWIQAMNKESLLQNASLLQNDTWEVIDPPPNRKPMSCK